MDFQQLADQSKFMFHPAPLEDGVDDQSLLNVGLDIGYGSLKAMSKYGLHRVQSLVIPFEKPQTGDFTIEDIYMNEGDIIYIENIDTPEEQIWAVGRKALDTINTTDVNLDMDEYYNKKWFLNKEFQILFNLGMFLAQLRSDYTLAPEVEYYSACIGLPVQWIKLSDELRESMLGKRSFTVLMDNGQLYSMGFEIFKENIHVIPQHEGSIHSVMLDYEGNTPDPMDFVHKDILLVDAGNRTVDTHLLLRKNQGKSKTWLDVSMLSIKEEVCNYILEATSYKREVYGYQLDRFIAGEPPCQVRFGKRYIDFSAQLEGSIKKHVQTLAKRLEMVYTLDDLDHILISGGSGLCYFDELKEALADYDLYLVQDLDGVVPYNATYSNAVGFYKLLVLFSKQKKVRKERQSSQLKGLMEEAIHAEVPERIEREDFAEVLEPPSVEDSSTEPMVVDARQEPQALAGEEPLQEAAAPIEQASEGQPTLEEPPALEPEPPVGEEPSILEQLEPEPLSDVQVKDQPVDELLQAPAAGLSPVMQKLAAIPEDKKSPMLSTLEKRAMGLPEGSPQREQVEHMIEVLLKRFGG